MKRILAGLLVLAALLAVGCSGAAGGGPPKATAPELKFDFGDVPTTADPRNHEFFIKNEGGSDLKISGAQVKLLQGC